jgi:hypothetical protein
LGQDTEVKAMIRLALESFETYIKLNKKVPEDVLGPWKEVSGVERFRVGLCPYMTWAGYIHILGRRNAAGFGGA